MGHRTASFLIPLLMAALAGVAPNATAFAAQASRASEILGEIRVHGNYATPDADVVRLAGVTVGQPIGPGIEAEVRERLVRTGRFIGVEVRKRFRDLEGTDAALIIIVQEYPLPDAAPSPLRPLRRTLGSAMFMPILNYADGYGLTYGARVSFVDGLGKSARLSIPASWGGTKRVAAEFERTLEKGPIDRLTASAAIVRRTNPFYDTDVDRRSLSIGASRPVAGALRINGRAGMNWVRFGTLEDRYPFVGAGVSVDTRTDPVFPRNAVYASVDWARSSFRSTGATNQVALDGRGYVGVIGQIVLSLRAQYARADRPLPEYERYLLGGAGTLRGYRAGSFSGDTLAAATVELRVPISSPLSFGRAGVTAFADTGAVVNRGERLRDAPWRRGFGGGFFFSASIFQLNADVAVREGGHARLHVTSGFQF